MPERTTENLSGQLRSDARVDRDYLALLVVAAIVASLGLEQNSPATIIGAMVVAPLMLPIRTLGYGILRFDRSTLLPALQTLVLSMLLVILIGAGVGWIAQRPEFGSEILSRTSVTFLGLGVAIAGGTLAGLSRALGTSRITDSLVGVGISVSLVPPLCVTGIALAFGRGYESLGALVLFLTNLVGIAVACAAVFWATGHASERWSRTLAGAAVFAVAITAISPALAQAAFQARELSAIEAFQVEHSQEYLPSAEAIESTVVLWNERPTKIITTARTTVPPTKEQVSKLNAALNAHLRRAYRLTLVVDPAIAIEP